MAQNFRITPQHGFNWSGELIVDNFAGGGGASTGIEAAMERPVDIAINHDPAAVALHEVNHPLTQHFCESVWDVDPRKVTAGRPVGLAWFSPDCKHFSKAKGGKPVEKKIRGLAWVVMRWVATVRPRVIMLENVEEFTTWGPLVRNENGECYPCQKNKGRTFRSFVNALEHHGYNVEWRELRACDYGAPTIRKRLFLVARCDGEAITWPEPTHGDPKSETVKSGRLKPWRTAAEIIDWTVPCPSIFERSRPLAEATLRRIAKGVQRYVVEAEDPFIVPTSRKHKSKKGAFLTEHANASSARVFNAEEPLRTQCAETKGGHFALVSPTLVQTGYGERPGQSPRVPGLDKPLGTVVAGGQKHGLVSAFLAKHYGGVVGSDLQNPIGTVTTVDHHSLVMANLVRNFGKNLGAAVADPTLTITSKSKDGLATCHLVKLRETCQDGQPVTDPLHTISAQGQHLGEVRAFLIKYYGTDQDPNPMEPLHTVTTKDRFGLVTVQGEQYQIMDIGMRMLTPRELYRAQGFPENYVIDRDANGRPITKTEQIAKCGNSVCPPIAEALVRANLVETARTTKAA